MKDWQGTKSKTAFIYILGPGWRWLGRFRPRPLYPHGKTPKYSLNRRLRGSQSLYGSLARKNSTGTVLYVWRNIETYSCNLCCSGKVITITYSQCVSVALCIKNPLRMCHIVIYGLSGSAILFTLSHKRHDFRKILLNSKCLFLFSL